MTMSLCSFRRHRTPGLAEGQHGPRSQGQERADLEFDPQSDPKVSFFFVCFVCFATLPPAHREQVYVTVLCKV